MIDLFRESPRFKYFERLYNGLKIGAATRQKFVFQGKDRFWYQRYHPHKKTISVFYMGAKGFGRYQFPVIMGGAPDNYYVRQGGTASNKGDAFGPGSVASACMSRATHNIEPTGGFAAGDYVYLCDDGGDILGGFVPPSPGWEGSSIVYLPEPGDIVEIVGGGSHCFEIHGGKHYLTIQDMTLKDTSGTKQGAHIEESHHLILQRLMIKDTNHSAISFNCPNAPNFRYDSLVSEVTVRRSLGGGSILMNGNSTQGRVPTHVTVQDCDVREGAATSTTQGDCLRISHGEDITFLRNYLEQGNPDTGNANGIDNVGSPRSLIAFNVVIGRSSGDGSDQITLKDDSEDAEIYNNVIYARADYGSSPVGLNPNSNGIIKNNIIVATSAVNASYRPVIDGDANANVYDYNLILNEKDANRIGQWDAAFPNWSEWQAAGNDPNGFNEDPLWIDPNNGDFRLQPTSPCINAGADVGFPFNGTAPDIGAYEFQEAGMEAIDNGDGTYALTLTSGTVIGKATITGEVNGMPIVDIEEVDFTAGAADPATSEILAAPSSIPADGSSTSQVIVQLKDANGNPLTQGGDTVILNTDLGTLS